MVNRDEKEGENAVYVKGKLTTRQKKFAEAYLQCGCAAKAAEEAGFDRGYGSAAMRQPAVQTYLKKRRKEIADAIPLTEDVIRVIVKVASGELPSSKLSPDDRAQVFAARIIVNAMKIGNAGVA